MPRISALKEIRGQSAELSFDPRLLDDDEDPRFTAADREEERGGGTDIVMNLSSEARLELGELIQKAISGQLRPHRPLLPHQPDKLNAEHIQMIMMKAAGIPQGQIASVMQYTEAWVSTVLGHPVAKQVLAQVLAFAAQEIVDIPKRIKGMAPRMLDVIEEVTFDPKSKPELRSSNAFKMLEAAGYGAEQQHNHKHQHEVSIPKEQMGSFLAAMKESQQGKDISHLTYARVLDQPVRLASGEGSGGAESGEAGLLGNVAPTGVAQPPRNGHQDPQAASQPTDQSPERGALV